MSNDVGYDKNGRCWFKSPQSLTDVTDACNFYVAKTSSSFVGKLLGKAPEYHLVAKYRHRPGYLTDKWVQMNFKYEPSRFLREYDEDVSPPALGTNKKPDISVFTKIIGVYDNFQDASNAIGDIMKARAIKSIYDD